MPRQLIGILSLPAPAEPYEGDYIVTPKAHLQSLPTRNKYMVNNLTVLQVPYYETSNTYGNTVYIASEA